MAISQITLLGGDLRHAYTAEYLNSCGYVVTCFGTPDFPYQSNIQLAASPEQALHTDALFMPTPFSKDNTHLFQKSSSVPPIPISQLSGMLSHPMVIFHNGMPNIFQEQFENADCKLYALSDSSRFATENARLTAEGLLSEVIRYTPFSLENTRILLLGYGYCGAAIGTLFSTFESGIYVLEREISKQLQAEEHGLLALSEKEKKTILPRCNLVINTIPQQILTNEDLALLPGDCHIFDIASAPFGFSNDVSSRFAIPYFRLPGLPGKFHPKTAGIIAGNAIERMINHGL